MSPLRTATPFADRQEAGRALGEALAPLAASSPIIVALPRGGVPVAYEVAEALGAPLDIALVRKVGAPQHPELGVGAIAEGGQLILDGDAISSLGISRDALSTVIEREREELERRRDRYRGEGEPLDVSGRTVILVDDGLATGGTAIAAGRMLRARGAGRVIAAVPVCPQGSERALEGEFDEFICLLQPRHFGGVGAWYDDFSQTTDREVLELLERAGREPGAERSAPDAGPDPEDIGERAVVIEAGPGVSLHADLRVPRGAGGLIVFAHGSGSGRHSPRNRWVAERLNEAGFATLLLDLLSEREEADRANVFDIELLAERLVAAARWAASEPALEGLPLGLFGASTGAGAAAVAAARAPELVAAIVSRGGRPDLADGALAQVRAPTLLIVGGADEAVLGLNRIAAGRLGGPSEISVVPGAGHLFEEPGALDRVAELAAAWFAEHLAPSSEATETGAAGP